MQIYENKAFFVIGMFLDTRFIESVVIQINYYGLGFIMIVLLLMNLHEIQMPVTWQMNALYLYTMQYMMLELWII